MPSITLKSSDDKVFKVDTEVATQSVTIKDMLAYSRNEEEEEEPVPLPNVRGAILEKVLEWAAHHKDDPPHVEDENTEMRRTDDIPEWDQAFLKLENPVLFEMVLAANYLDIKPLLDVTCKTVANKIKGKTPEEIRNNFKQEEQTPARGEEVSNPAATPVAQPDASSEVQMES